ncbi:MAG: hypothetical protein AAF196_02465 [Planctomycetota bacterium]
MTERLKNVGPNDRTVGWMLWALSREAVPIWVPRLRPVSEQVFRV